MAGVEYPIAIYLSGWVKPNLVRCDLGVRSAGARGVNHGLPLRLSAHTRAE